MTKTIDCLQENYIIEPLYIYPLCATISPLYHNIPFVPQYPLCTTISPLCHYISFVPLSVNKIGTRVIVFLNVMLHTGMRRNDKIASYACV